MRNQRTKAFGIVAALTLASIMSACGQTSDTDSIVESTEAEVVTSEKYGQVTEVDGSSITVQLGTIEEPDMSGAPNGDNAGDGNAPSGEAPEKPDGDNADDGNAPSGEAPEKPDGDNAGDGNAPSGETPEKPDGDNAGDGNAPSGETPEKPNGDNTGDGNAPSGEAPEKPDGDNAGDGNAPGENGEGGAPGEMDFSDMFTAGDETYTFVVDDESILDGLTLSEIEEGDILVLTMDEDEKLISVSAYEGNGGMGGGPGGSDNSSITYTAVTTYTEDTKTDGETYESTGKDEEAVLVDNGATVTINNPIVNRTSDESTGGDNSSFYGVGAGVLALDGTVTINGGTITTDSAGGAGVFAYGDGVVNISDTTIRTSKDTSGGIHVAGGGTLHASNLDVETNGASAAAIRSDRGGGTMTVDGGTYTSNGSGSPAVYCTADITVDDATLEATGSEAVCIEGLNSLVLKNVDLTGNMPDDDQNDITWTVILYQSMSGDSEVGTSVFNMTGGSLTSKNGGMFYTTNTESEFYLSGVTLNYSDDDDFLLQCTGNANKRGWGSTGSNGAQCTFTADDQELQGVIVYDSISTLDFILQNGSTFTGTFRDDESYAGNGGDGTCDVTIDETSTWVVTEDCTVSSLTGSGKIVDENGKTVTIQGADGTVYVKGTGNVTVTVGSYEA